MNWHTDWQDGVVVLAAAMALGLAAWLRVRLPKDRCRACALRDQHGAPFANG